MYRFITALLLTLALIAPVGAAQLCYTPSPDEQAALDYMAQQNKAASSQGYFEQALQSVLGSYQTQQHAADEVGLATAARAQPAEIQLKIKNLALCGQEVCP